MPWTRFSEERPLPNKQIFISNHVGVHTAFIPDDNHSVFQVVGESERRPINPKDEWSTDEEDYAQRMEEVRKQWWLPYPKQDNVLRDKDGGIYQMPPIKVTNKHHPEYVNGEPDAPVKFEIRDTPRSEALQRLVDKFGPKVIEDNPKDVAGSKKLPCSTLPWAVLAEAAAGMGEGAIKYGKHNYEVVGIRYSIYFDACMRHLIAAMLGEDIDPDSGVPHITKALTTLLVLRDAQIYNKCTDDRPPACPPEHLQQVKDLFSKLIADIPDCGKHYDRASMEKRNERPRSN